MLRFDPNGCLTPMGAVPAAEIEIADAEIGAVRKLERLPEGKQKLQRDVVEDARHGCSLARESALLWRLSLWELWCLK